MKKILVVLIMSLSISAIAQQNFNVLHDKNAQLRRVGSFTAIKVSSAIDLYLSQSDKNEVAVSASEDEIRDRIITEVEGSTLIIKMQNSNGWFNWKSWNNVKTKAYVSIKDINALTASGASNVHIIGKIESPKLKLHMSGASDLKDAQLQIGTLLMDISGASNIRANIKATNISIEGSGASDIELQGSTDDLSLNLSGACHAKMYKLAAKGALIDLSGASNADVNVSDIIRAKTAGASDVNYIGNATIKESSNSGASKIKHRN